MNLATTATQTITNGALAAIDGTPNDIKPFLVTDAAETARQIEVLTARRYHEGRHAVQLTDRLREFIDTSVECAQLRINVARTINMAVAERLTVEGFDVTAGTDAEKASQREFAMRVWDGSRMKAHQADIHEEAVTDGEHFLLIDFDTDSNVPRLTPHKRYTDATVSAVSRGGSTLNSILSAPQAGIGDGEGVRLFYPNNDTSQKPYAATKRWTESYVENGKTKTRARLTLYRKPDGAEYHQAEKYVYDIGGWKPHFETQNGVELAWPQILVNPRNGEDLGLPVVHLKMPKLRPEAMEAWGIQQSIGKSFIDLLTAADMTAFRILLTFGWQMVDSAGNALEFAPGTNIGTTSGPDKASAQVIDGADLTQFRATIQDLILWACAATDTPPSRFQMSGQIRAEGTLQEEKESLVVKCTRRATTLETAYEDALRIARRWHNAFSEGLPLLDEEAHFEVQWKEFFARSIEDRKTEAEALLASGADTEYVQRVVWNIAEEDMKAMQTRAREMMFGEGVMRTADATS
jgi:hypothetical protein